MFARVGGRRGRLGLLVGVLAVVAVVAGLLAGAAITRPAAASATQVTVPPCAGKTAAGPFVVKGNTVYSEVAGGKLGQPFISYGTSMAGLEIQGSTYSGPASANAGDEQKIAATAKDWCGNTVRLQVGQYLLFDRGKVNQNYLAAIRAEVSYALNLHMIVVLNDSTESSPDSSSLAGPTAATEAFWKEMATYYSGQPDVIFDLFNEPRLYLGSNETDMWQSWFDGTTAQTKSYLSGGPYIGMEALAQYVRNTLRVPNLFWVEGPDYSGSFNGMLPNYKITKVSNLVYAIHHPEAPMQGPDGPAYWGAAYGYLLGQGYAVVEGEWTNHEPAPGGCTGEPWWDQSPPLPCYGTWQNYCWPDAPTAVPMYLQWLSSLGIGLNVYNLAGGSMIINQPTGKPANFSEPTTINRRTWTCEQWAERQPGQGAGLYVYWFFRHQNLS
jgi:hypothetical protein